MAYLGGRVRARVVLVLKGLDLLLQFIILLIELQILIVGILALLLQFRVPLLQCYNLERHLLSPRPLLLQCRLHNFESLPIHRIFLFRVLAAVVCLRANALAVV